MFKSGRFVADYLEPHDGSELDEDQIQPCGVDLKVDEILHNENSAVLTDKEYSKPKREEAPIVKPNRSEIQNLIGEDTSRLVVGNIASSLNLKIAEDTDNPSDFTGKEYYALHPGYYSVVYNEKIAIPEDFVGFVWPRSRMMRSAATLHTAVWDPGYVGRGEGGLAVFNPIFIEKDMKIGQMTFTRAEDIEERYSKTHQGERL